MQSSGTVPGCKTKLQIKFANRIDGVQMRVTMIVKKAQVVAIQTESIACLIAYIALGT